MKFLSRAWPSATPWTAAYQAPLSIGFTRQEYWSGLPLPSPILLLIQFSSVAQSCPTLCDPINHSTTGFLVQHQFPEFTQTNVHWVGDTIQPSHPLSSPSLPSIFPGIRVFSNESALRIRWPKYWSFSLNISPSSEHPGLIFVGKVLSLLFNMLSRLLITFLPRSKHSVIGLWNRKLRFSIT